MHWTKNLVVFSNPELDGLSLEPQLPKIVPAMSIGICNLT